MRGWNGQLYGVRLGLLDLPGGSIPVAVRKTPAIAASAAPATLTVPAPSGNTSTVNLPSPAVNLPSPVAPIHYLGPPVPADTQPGAWTGLLPPGGVGTQQSPAVPIPPNGPLPPGNGYQQVEAPGNSFPYVFIGQGTPPGTTPGSVCAGPRFIPDPFFWSATNTWWNYQGQNGQYDIYEQQDGQDRAIAGPNGYFIHQAFDQQAIIPAYQCPATQQAISPTTTGTVLPLPNGGSVATNPPGSSIGSGNSLITSAESGLSNIWSFVQSNWIPIGIGLGLLIFLKKRH